MLTRPLLDRRREWTSRRRPKSLGNNELNLRDVQEAARAIGLQIHALYASTSREIDCAVKMILWNYQATQGPNSSHRDATTIVDRDRLERLIGIAGMLILAAADALVGALHHPVEQPPESDCRRASGRTGP
jgi:hypothetical protein